MNPIRDEWRSEDGAVRLILGDCLDVLPTLSGIDAVVTDPPYGIGYKQSGGRGAAGKSRFCGEGVVNDDVPFNPASCLQYGNVVLWGANYYRDRLPCGGRFLVWDKRCGVTPQRDQADAEMAWHNIGNATRVFRHVWDGMIRDSEAGPRVHPTQKPVRVMVWSLEQAGIGKGQTVLDPYMGSGTTGVACVRTGRRFVGIEIERKYWEIAVRRVRAELERFPLFEPAARPRQLELLDAGDVSVSVDCPE
jgi:site-specific DNA-methyltransferase (adenine-specific)